MDQPPSRKRNRLENYDYSQPGAYLITICVDNRRQILGTVKAHEGTYATDLSPLGRQVETAVHGIDTHYENVTVDAFSILPNHVHLLIRIRSTNSPNPPSVSRIVKQMKESVTKASGERIWQKGFHDHVIRTDADYLDAWRYVTYNAAKWEVEGKPVKR